MSRTAQFRVEKLDQSHDLAGFACGEDALDLYLKRYALTNQRAGASQTYVALEAGKVIGFYTLTVGQVAHADAIERVAKGMPRHPIPVMLLARLALDRVVQGRGIGFSLLKDALRRTLQAAEIAGVRAMFVQAKHDNARRFYERFGFSSSPVDPLHLFLLLKDARRILDRA